MGWWILGVPPAGPSRSIRRLLSAPKGTPPDTIQKLAKAATASIQDPALHKKLIDMELEPTGFGPDRLAQIMKADYEKWGPPIRASGFTPQ